MFTQIAPRYDLLNHVLSLQMDRLWRARVARILSADFVARRMRWCWIYAAGPGIWRCRWRAAGPGAGDWGGFCACDAGAGAAKSADGAISFVEADALRLPFADGSFDL